jgi:transcriptional regulator with XRE-family HTH domain
MKAGKLIQLERRKRGEKAHDLAAAVGVSVGTIENIEQGRTSGREETRRRIAVHLGIDPAALGVASVSIKDMEERIADRAAELAAPRVAEMVIERIAGLTVAIKPQRPAQGSHPLQPPTSP